MSIKKHLPYVVFCLIIPVVLLLPLIYGHTLYFGNDLSFHVSRFYEIEENIRHGNWIPYVNTYTFNHAGVPLNMMYGTLLIYPIAVCMFITGKTISGIYLGIAIVIAISMLVSYWIFYKYSKDSRKSLLFALLYNISVCFFNFIIDGFNFGESAGMVWLPMVVYGTYQLFHNSNGNDWIYLSLGLSLTLYNHILSFIMFLGLTLFIYIIGLFMSSTSVRIRSLKNIIKAALLGLCLSMFFICEFLSIFLRNNMRLADPKNLSGIVPSELLSDTLNNHYIGGLLLILFIIVLVNYRKLDFNTKISCWLSIFFAFLMTSYADLLWTVINHTPLTFLQWTGRLVVIVQLFVSVAICNYCYENWSLNNSYRYIALLSLIIIVFMSNFVSWKGKVDSYVTVSNSQKVFPTKNYKIMDDLTLKNMISGKYKSVGSLDYLKKNSYSDALTNNKWNSYLNGKKVKVSEHSIPNGIIYSLDCRNSGTLNTKFYDYSKYKVTNNSQVISYKESNRGTIAIRLKKGINKIIIQYERPLLVTIGIATSTLSFIILIIWKLFRRNSYFETTL